MGGDTTFGLAFGSFVRDRGGERFCVGYDGRHSSPALARRP
ncbi:MAG: hypothetical protein R3D66_05200 [Alphaproteobacteria bacterium]